jgi:hypothetical protein
MLPKRCNSNARSNSGSTVGLGQQHQQDGNGDEREVDEPLSAERVHLHRPQRLGDWQPRGADGGEEAADEADGAGPYDAEDD